MLQDTSRNCRLFVPALVTASHSGNQLRHLSTRPSKLRDSFVRYLHKWHPSDNSQHDRDWNRILQTQVTFSSIDNQNNSFFFVRISDNYFLHSRFLMSCRLQRNNLKPNFRLITAEEYRMQNCPWLRTAHCWWYLPNTRLTAPRQGAGASVALKTLSKAIMGNLQTTVNNTAHGRILQIRYKKWKINIKTSVVQLAASEPDPAQYHS
jgi:hypothetical protein